MEYKLPYRIRNAMWQVLPPESKQNKQTQNTLLNYGNICFINYGMIEIICWRDDWNEQDKKEPPSIDFMF